MQIITLCCTLAVTLSCLLMLPVQAANTPTPTQTAPDQNALKASAAASLSWLQLLDRGDYGKSWDDAAALMKLTVPKNDWIQILNKMRKPFGSVKSRQVADQRTAKDPQGLPKGDYMVLFYNTEFSSKSGAHELVTLYFDDGKWNVLTYQVD